MEATEVKPVNFKFLQAPEASRLIAQGMREKNEKLRFFGSFSSHVFQAVDYIIEKYYQSGEIAVGYMVSACTTVAKVVDAYQFFYHLIRTNQRFYEQRNIIFAPVPDGVYPNMKPDFEDDVIALGELTDDYEDSDPDPYQTAGGYRNWKALKGTSVVYKLSKDLSVYAVFLSNCMVDHYNNNFGGLSTGGGTTNYKIGERTELRGIRLGREFLDKGYTKTNANFKADIIIIDAEKAFRLCAKFQPDFADIIR